MEQLGLWSERTVGSVLCLRLRALLGGVIATLFGETLFRRLCKGRKAIVYLSDQNWRFSRGAREYAGWWFLLKIVRPRSSVARHHLLRVAIGILSLIATRSSTQQGATSEAEEVNDGDFEVLSFWIGRQTDNNNEA